MSWNTFYKKLKHELRMSDIQIARQCGLSQTTLNRLSSGKIEHPQLSTIKQLEEGLSISIDDLDINNIKYRKLEGDDPVAKHYQATKKKPEGLKSFPLVSNTEKFIKLVRDEKVLSIASFQKIADTNILLSYNSDNAVAITAESDRNSPFILKGDVILLDLGSTIDSGDWVAVVLKDDRYLLAQITRYDDSSIFSFYNSGAHNPIAILNKEIRFIAKIVKVSRNL